MLSDGEGAVRGRRRELQRRRTSQRYAADWAAQVATQAIAIQP
ncbi:MAG: hypothetical protein ACK542_08065 [Burkholderiales bacterium]